MHGKETQRYYKNSESDNWYDDHSTFLICSVALHSLSLSLSLSLWTVAMASHCWWVPILVRRCMLYSWRWLVLSCLLIWLEMSRYFYLLLAYCLLHVQTEEYKSEIFVLICSQFPIHCMIICTSVCDIVIVVWNLQIFCLVSKLVNWNLNKLIILNKLPNPNPIMSKY